MARNYKSEYENYQGTSEQKKRRAMRNKARRIMTRKGKASKGDGMDVEHVSGSPMNSDMHNLKMGTKKANRSFPRTKKARKKNKKD